MFIVLPVGMNYETRRLPIVTFAIMGINILVYLVSLVSSISTDGNSNDWVYLHLWLIPGMSNWTAYLTSMFVHAGFFHLLGNMIFLFLFGCCVEDILGRLRFAILYLVCGFVAELVFIASTPDHFASLVPMGGASGAISGCMGMYLLLRASAEIEFKYFYFFLFFGANAGDFSLPAWVAITFWFLKDLFWMIVGMNLQQSGGGTAFGAHVGGFLAGLALVGLYRLITLRNEPAKEAVTRKPAFRPISTDPQAITRTRQRAAIRVRPKPIVEAGPGEIASIFLYDNGQQSGPFTLTHIQQMLQIGTISQEVLYWSEGMTEWRNVTELAG